MSFGFDMEPVDKETHEKRERLNTSLLPKLVESRKEPVESQNKIYHYTDLGAAQSIIANKCLYASNCKFLNDKEEIKYAISVLNEVVKGWKEDDQGYIWPYKDKEISVWSDALNHYTVSLWLIPIAHNGIELRPASRSARSHGEANVPREI